MTGRWVRAGTVAAVLVVAGVAAVISFAHLAALAERSGEGWRAYLLPVSVDGLMLASTLALVDRRRVGQPAGWMPWSGLALGILASLAGNVAAARADLVAQLVAGWPPVALALSIEVLVIVLRQPVASLAEPSPASPGGPPAGSESTPADPAAEPSEDGLAERTRQLVAEDPAIGRARLAAALGVSEHRARQLRAAVGSTNGTHPG